MGRKKSAFIAMILTFVMIVSTSVPTFALNMSETYSNQEESEADLENIAELEAGDDAAGLRQDTFEPVVLVNPLYADVVNPEDIEVVQYSEKPAGSSEALVGSSGEEIPTTEEEFAEAYRQAFDETLGEWGTQFTVQYKVLSDEEISNEQCNEYFNMLADVALENQFIHNGNPTQGDYGLFQYAGQSYGGGLESGYDYETGKYYLIINFDTLLTYYTTPEQEAEESAMLSTVMDFLNLNTKTEYGKIKAIYDYICQHVTYDFANLNNDSYDLKYTSYAALVNGTAVCQGYSALFYRMALEAGLDARIVSGYGGDGGAGGGGPHAWNIVRLKGLYYNMDCTWDAGRDPYDYFLKCPDTFDLHARDAEYETVSFHASYPMATTDYVVVPEDLIEVTDISDCTIALAQTNYIYDGSPKEPSVTVTDGSVTLSYGTDYEVTYSENIDAGVASVTINGVGSYTGSVREEFVIDKAPAELSFANDNVTKTLSDEVFINGLTGNTDGDITYESSDSYVASVDAVSGAVSIEGTGIAVITATSAESDNYEAGSAQYTLTVKDVVIEIITQPEDVEILIGKKATFSVEASGEGLTYQWQYQKYGRTTWSKSSLTGSQTDTLTVSATSNNSGTKYRCVVTDIRGKKATSEAALLTVIPKPEIITQPESVEAYAGDHVELTVEASGIDLTYQWQYRNAGTGTWRKSSLASATLPTFSFKMSSSYNGREYRCKVTGKAGGVAYTEPVVITQLYGPSITGQPEDTEVLIGNKAIFYVEAVDASGEGLTYQWQYQKPGKTTWTNSTLSSSQTNTLSVTATSNNSGTKYRCSVTDNRGKTVNTKAAILTVIPKPEIITQPESVEAYAGNRVELTVEASGTELTYQWQYKNAGTTTWKKSTLSSATLPTLSFKMSSSYDGRQYRCKITGKAGGVTYSKAAYITRADN